MVNNAKDAPHRIRTIFYLYRFRYEASALEAGERLAQEQPENLLCKQAIEELRGELTSPCEDLGMMRMNNIEVREYLAQLIKAFDATVKI